MLDVTSVSLEISTIPPQRSVNKRRLFIALSLLNMNVTFRKRLL